MGRKTSVWLPDELAERVSASGVPLGELIRRGLDAGGPVPLESVVRGAVEAAMRDAVGGVDGAVGHWREVTGPVIRAEAEREMGGCPHPGARVIKGLCGACGRNVGSEKVSS